MAVMRKDNVDWKEFAEALLWWNVVAHKNEDSYYDLIVSDKYSNGRGYNVGDIGHFRICSYYVGEFIPLTWKQLALALGLFEDHLIHDGHDCKICPKRDGCTAYFKDDPDHERCNGWEETTKEKQ